MYSSTLSLKSSVPGEQFSTADAASILKQAVESKMIDLAYLQEQMDMLKKQELLKLHTYKISYDEKRKYWYTYFRDPEKGRIKRKNVKKEELEKVIIQHYQENNEKMQQQEYSFKSWWKIWRETQMSYGVSNNTLSKYDADYKRFLQGKEFENKDIRKITEEDVKVFMVTTIKEKNLKEKAARGLWGYIMGVFKIAKIRHAIQEDPCTYVDSRMFKKLYNKNQKPVEQRILNDDELLLLKNRLMKDHEREPLYMQSYAVELAIFTGMRVGELAALKWENVLFHDEMIIISESEKYDRFTKEYYISRTKTDKIRHYPMTDEIELFLKNLMKIQVQNDILGEYVFSNENGRISAPSISDCMRFRCKQIGISARGIHALRRTLNSKLRCSGVSATVAASLLGHSEEVNQTNYTYDITGMDYKKEIVKKVIS